MRLVHCLRTVLNWRIVCLTAPPQITSSTFCCCASGPPPTCAHMPTTSSPLCWRQAALRFAMLRCAALGWAGLGWARAGLWRAAFRAVLTSKQALLLNTPFATCPTICLQEDLAASAGGDDAFEAYCAELEGTAAWGGQVELQVGAPTASVGCQICRSLQFDAELRGRAARWSCRWAPAQQAGVVKSASSAQWRPLVVCCGEQTGRASKRAGRPGGTAGWLPSQTAGWPGGTAGWLCSQLTTPTGPLDPAPPPVQCRRCPGRCSPTSRSSLSRPA